MASSIFNIARARAFGFDDGRLKTADYHSQSGFGLRGVSGETTAFAHANEISEAAIDRAAATLKLLDPAKGAPRRAAAAHQPGDVRRRRSAEPGPVRRQGRAVPADRRRGARPRSARRRRSASRSPASWSVIDIVRPDGFVASDVRPLVRLGVQIVAEQNGRRETGYHGLGGRYLYDDLFEEADWNRAIDIALAQALINLESVAAPAGEMQVVLGPGWPGVLLHEAIGHGLEGDFNRKGTSAFSGRIGERVAAPGVTVVDDGAIGAAARLAHHRRRGHADAPHVLIEDGILKGYIQDRLNARLMGVEPTGNGRRESFAHAPMPRMTNTFMLGGKDDPAEIVSRVERRHLRQELRRRPGRHHQRQVRVLLHRGLSDRERQDRRADQGRDPDRRRPDRADAGRAIGNDMALDEGIGVCGKGGQSVPAGVGQPTLLIDGLTVGGTAA